MTYTHAYILLGVLEALGIVWAVALCRAAARRPIVVPRNREDQP